MKNGIKPSHSQLVDIARLREHERLVTRQAAMDSSYAMAAYVLWPDVADKHYYEPLHGPLCEWVDSASPGSRKGVIISRAHRKSMLLTVAHAIRRIVVDPNIRILVVSAVDKKAKDLSSLILRQFTSNKSFAYFFPEFVIPDSAKNITQYSFIHPLRTNMALADPTLQATFLGASMLGSRADIIICDDAIADKEVATPELTAKTNSRINELIPFLDINPQYNMMFIIGTPKSYADYYALMDGQSAATDDEVPPEAKFDVIRRAATENAQGEPDLDGEPILPNVFTKEALTKIYNQCRLDPDKGESYYYREYLVMVQAPKDQKFLPEWFDSWIEPQQIPPTVFSAASIDSALKDEQILFKGDRMVILIGHRDAYGNLYLTDGARSQAWRTEDFRKVLISMCQNKKNRGVQNILKEKVGEGTLFSIMRGWFNDARLPAVLRPIKVIGQGKKYLRITEALQQPAMAGKIFFVNGMFPRDIHKVIVDELTHLGQWGHDDAADALSLFFHPDVNIVPQQYVGEASLPRMTRPQQLSTIRTVPAMLGWQAKVMQTKPTLDSSGALIDFTKPVHEQVETRAAYLRRGLVDEYGIKHYINPSTGKVEK